MFNLILDISCKRVGDTVLLILKLIEEIFQFNIGIYYQIVLNILEFISKYFGNSAI